MSQDIASHYINVARRFGNQIPNFSEFKPTVLYALAAPSTPDEVVDQAVAKAEAGEKVTAADIKAWKADRLAREEAEERAAEAEDKAAKAKAEAQEIAKDRDAEKGKKDQYTKDLLAADRKLKDANQALKDAEEVYRGQLAEETRRIQDEEKKRPRTTEEEKASKQRLHELKEKLAELQQDVFKLEGDRREVKKQLEDERAAVKLRDKVIGDFQKAALRYREDVIAIIATAESLRQIPMTDKMHAQIEMLLGLTEQALTSLKKATYVEH